MRQARQDWRFEVLSIGASCRPRVRRLAPGAPDTARSFAANASRPTTIPCSGSPPTPPELAKGTGLLAEEVGHPDGIHGIFEDQPRHDPDP
jgi:hypothetical protein